MNSKGLSDIDSRSSKEAKKMWIDGAAASLARKGHTKQRARAMAKEAYRNRFR